MANPSADEIREDVEAWARGDFDVAFRHWHEDVDSRMVVLGTTRVFGKRSGMAVEEPLAFVLEMRDGKVARAVSYRDHAKALEAAGE